MSWIVTPVSTNLLLNRPSAYQLFPFVGVYLGVIVLFPFIVELLFSCAILFQGSLLCCSFFVLCHWWEGLFNYSTVSSIIYWKPSETNNVTSVFVFKCHYNVLLIEICIKIKQSIIYQLEVALMREKRIFRNLEVNWNEHVMCLFNL